MEPTPGSLVPSLVRRMSPAILYILKLTLGHKEDIISAASALEDTFEALKEGNKWNKIDDTLKRIDEFKRTLLDKRSNTALTLQQKREFWLKPTSKGIPATPYVAKTKKRKRKSNREVQSRSIATPMGHSITLLSKKMDDPPSSWSLDSSWAPATDDSISSLSAGMDEGVSAVNGAQEDGPSFLVGAVVLGLPWTDGGGHTAKIYGEGFACGRVEGQAEKKRLSNGDTALCYQVWRADHSRTTFWPARLLRQTCLALGSSGPGGRQSTAERNAKRKANELTKQTKDLLIAFCSNSSLFL